MCRTTHAPECIDKFDALKEDHVHNPCDQVLPQKVSGYRIPGVRIVKSVSSLELEGTESLKSFVSVSVSRRGCIIIGGGVTIVISCRKFIIRDRTRSEEVVENTVPRSAKLGDVGVEEREDVERFDR